MKKYENGCCITAVMRPTRGVTVVSSGTRTDIRRTFGVMCYEFLKSNLLTYEDMRLELLSALIMESTTQ